MRASFAIFAAAAVAPAYALVARGQDSSNFLQDTAPQAPAAAASQATGVYTQDSSNFNLDTAPQGYSQVVSQIPDGQPQAPTAVPVEPSSILPPAISQISDGQPQAPTPPSVEVPSVVVPTVSEVIPTPPIETLPPVLTETPIVPSEVPTSIPTGLTLAPPSFPNATATTPIGGGRPSTTGEAPPPSTPTGAASSVQAYSTFGLVAAMVAVFLA